MVRELLVVHVDAPHPYSGAYEIADYPVTGALLWDSSTSTFTEYGRTEWMYEWLTMPTVSGGRRYPETDRPLWRFVAGSTYLQFNTSYLFEADDQELFRRKLEGIEKVFASVD